MPLDNVVIIPAPKPAEKKEVEEYTPEDFQGLTDAAMKSLGWDEPKKKEIEPEKKEATPEEAVKKVEAKEEPPKKEEKPAPVIPPSEPINATAIAEQAAEAAVRRGQEAVAAKAPKTEPDEIDPEDREHLDVFNVMAENPTYATLPKQYESFFRKEKAYKSNWEKANPGKTFNPDEHAEFYDKNEPNYDEHHYTRAEAKLESRREAKRIVDEQHRADRNEKDRIASTERVRSTGAKALQTLVESVAPDAVKEKGFSIDKLDELDPLANIVVEKVRGQMEPIVQAVDQILHQGQQPDMNNRVHQDVMRRVLDLETALATRPTSESSYQGRAFIKLEQFAQLPPERRGGYWTIWNHPEWVTAAIVNDFSSSAKATIEKIRTKHAPAIPAGSTNGDSDKTETPAKLGVAKPASPNTAHASDKGSSDSTKTDTQGTFGDQVARALWGG